MSRMHLVVDGRVLDDRYHGIGRVTAALLREIAAQDFCDVTVVLNPDQRAERFDLDALTTGLGHRVARFAPTLTSPRQYLAWPRLLRGLRADAALFPYHLGAALSGRARRLSVVHDCILETDPAFAPDTRTRLLYRLLTAVVVRRTEVIAPSRWSARDVARLYRRPAASIEVVPWGADTDFLADTGSSDPARPFAEPYFLHVGARRPHKNVAVLVRALAVVPPEFRLVLVGTVDARFPDPVPALVDELGLADRVVHLPSVTDAELRDLYLGAAAFLYPSHIEGVGLPLLEALVVGTPVVASDIPVFHEFAPQGVRFVPPDDVTGWAGAAVAAAAPGERTARAQAARAAITQLTWTSSVHRLRHLLDRSAQDADQEA
ncbi:MAG: glycosyltransferase family 4 protein [Jatrophihabitans sp.]|uniref:glycosyltransferase family 4 protein n=1 Tax=Jatrophihabitans sp. TaxID=1932789 RepID=UPI003F7D3303